MDGRKGIASGGGEADVSVHYDARDFSFHVLMCQCCLEVSNVQRYVPSEAFLRSCLDERRGKDVQEGSGH